MSPQKDEELAMPARLSRHRYNEREEPLVYALRDEAQHSQIYIQTRCQGHARLHRQEQRSEY